MRKRPCWRTSLLKPPQACHRDLPFEPFVGNIAWPGPAGGGLGQLRHRPSAQPGRGEVHRRRRRPAKLPVHRGRHPQPGRLPAGLPGRGPGAAPVGAGIDATLAGRPDHHQRRQRHRPLNMQVAARDAGVKRFDYAASSSTCGDHPGLPKVLCGQCGAGQFAGRPPLPRSRRQPGLQRGRG